MTKGQPIQNFHLKWVPRDSSYRLFDPQGRSVEPVNGFLRSLELRGLSPYTLRSYGYDLVIFYRWMSTIHRPFQDLMVSDLFLFIADQKKKKVHPKSINHRLKVCQLLYRFLFDRRIPKTKRGDSLSSQIIPEEKRVDFYMRKQRDPELQVKTPQLLIEPLKNTQVNSFLKGISTYRDLCLTLMMLLCGLRSGEILSLSISSVNCLECSIKVRGKGNKERKLPLPALILPLIEKYLRVERFPSSPSSDCFFVVLKGPQAGCSMTPAGLRSLFRYRRKVSGILLANPHRFRHIFASSMVTSRVPLPILQKLMGHSQIHTTMQYIHLSMTDIAEEYQHAMEKIQKRYSHASL